MEIFHPDSKVSIVFGQILGHPLGEGRDEDPLLLLHPLSYLLQKIIHLILGRLYLKGRIDSTRWAE